MGDLVKKLVNWWKFNYLLSGWRISGLPQRRWIGCILASIIYGTILALPFPGFEHQARQALAVFGVAIFLWATSVLPIAVTGLVILFLLPLSGALSTRHLQNSNILW